MFKSDITNVRLPVIHEARVRSAPTDTRVKAPVPLQIFVAPRRPSSAPGSQAAHATFDPTPRYLHRANALRDVILAAPLRPGVSNSLVWSYSNGSANKPPSRVFEMTKAPESGKVRISATVGPEVVVSHETEAVLVNGVPMTARTQRDAVFMLEQAAEQAQGA
ncbi:hypothetical protein BH09PSE5_BH09PSE5_03190 [soil metagenome]